MIRRRLFMYTYDESIFAKKNKWLLPLILFLVLGGLGAVALLIRYEVISVPAISGMIAPEPLLAIGVVMCCAGFIFLLNTFSSMSNGGDYQKDIAKFTESDILDQMNNHCVYVSGKEETPDAVVTDKYLVKPQVGITEISKISWIYRVNNNGRLSIRVKLLNNKDDTLAISAFDKTYKPMIEALLTVNPEILEGYDKKDLHMRRVK